MFTHFPLVQTFVQNLFASRVKVISILLALPVIRKKKKKNPDVFCIGLYFLFRDISALDSTGTDSWCILAMPGDFSALWGVCAPVVALLWSHGCAGSVLTEHSVPALLSHSFAEHKSCSRCEERCTGGAKHEKGELLFPHWWFIKVK